MVLQTLVLFGRREGRLLASAQWERPADLADKDRGRIIGKR